MKRYEVVPSGSFRKDLKLAKKRGLSLSDLYEVVTMLAEGQPLPSSFRNHLLSDDYKGYWECHINLLCACQN